MAIGERLREARMRQKIDIADVETATKIRAKYLRALENEEFALLPGNTFVKTFLRTYAEYLGLDPQLLLEEYRAGYEPRAEGELQPYSVAARRRQSENQRGRTRRRAPSGPPGPGTAVIVIIGVVLVIFAILGLTSGGKDDSGKSTQSADKKPAARKPKKKKQQAKPVAKVVRLRAAPSVTTYVCVDGGPGTRHLYEGNLSSARTFRGKRVRINAGSSSLKLAANGRRVRVAEPPGQTIGYDMRLRRGKVSSRPIPNGQRPCQ